ncbi:hypothetical protein B0T21DRAFT_363855 [Apiosordaria backusii]|uniref:Velvet domain-containing protein n=1 Tax=Apiosordaria backusii TaxID=314023 RepID=A0AA40BM98_9PEZI|nr:hypothetical protein B0T21DRAFT_363855 [Apiosordaria backusii]
MSAMPEDFRQQRRLMGTLVASPFTEICPCGAGPDEDVHGDRSKIVATAMSECFMVFNAKDFPGMKASTRLTRRLKEQGCLISIKKGNEKRETPGSTGSRRVEEDIEEEEGDSEGEEKRARKRVKRRSA